MPSLADIFTPDAFSVYELTAAIQKMPPANTRIAELGLFRDIPINTTLVAVEESKGNLMVVPTTKRGGQGILNKDVSRTVTSFAVPHIQVDDVVQSSDVTGVRAFGAEGVMATGEIVGRKMAQKRRNIDFTTEFLRVGALQGKVIFPDNSVDSALDLYTAFGLTNVGTDQQVLSFITGTATTKIVQTIIPQLHDMMEAALGGTPYTGIHVLCGRTFFRTLVGHAEVADLYKQITAQYALAAVTQAPGTVRRNMVTIDGVTFEEYYNVAGSGEGLGNDGLFQAAATGYAVPLGTDIFHSYYAPADIVEAAGTLGQPMYARQWLSPDGKSAHLEAQSNVLSICTRPRAIIKCTA